MLGTPKNLNKGDLAWLNEIYRYYPKNISKSAAKVLGKEFDLSGAIIQYHFSKKRRNEIYQCNANWRLNHKDQWNKICSKAVRKYYKTEKGKANMKKTAEKRLARKQLI